MGRLHIQSLWASPVSPGIDCTQLNNTAQDPTESVHHLNDATQSSAIPESMLPSPDAQHDEQAQQFLRSITTPADTLANLLATPAPRPRGMKLHDTTTIRRSHRIAVSGYGGTAVNKEQTLLMRKLGLIEAQDAISQEARDAYARLFEHPLSSAQIATVASLFGWTVPESCEARSAKC